LVRIGINWKRAKFWMTSPDPHDAVKKARRDRLIHLAAEYPDWVLGFEDETWWSRMAQPSLHAWTDGPPLKVQLLKMDDNDPDPEAICCYGILRNDSHQALLRFVEGRPLGEVTIQFLLNAPAEALVPPPLRRQAAVVSAMAHRRSFRRLL
jgi:hypothetical protein